MTPVYVHPVILQHPGRIERLEQTSGMQVVIRAGEHPRLVHPPVVIRPRREAGTGGHWPTGPDAA